MTNHAPTLRSLSPSYVPDEHGTYVAILTAKLAETGPTAPRNLALTGHYGSGKSSVLLETQRALEADDVKVINLSLPSLGIGDGRIPKDGDKALDRTNLIQKEIVKQLLYRRRPSDMPASRYSRLDKFQLRRALSSAAGVGTVAAATALLAKLPNVVRDSAPQKTWTWVNNHLPGNMAGPLQSSSILVVFILAAWFAVWAQRLLQQRLRVTELTAGPTKVTLTDSSSSYFDEYLDEIVYFFQTSATAVVIFEDLDRFKDPHIFEALRELNLLLNNAEQTGDTPIRFVYAIRDSIFEQLDVEVMTDDENPGLTREPSVDQGEVRRLMSTNRTKFFDLVVPMVPFISHRTSRGLIRDELGKVDEAQRPGDVVVDIVSAHLTDMRLIKNICNEYDVFRGQVLGSGGLHELTPDRLFASIVYKNLYLADYEKIRDGTSLLDELYRSYRDWVKQQMQAARKAEVSARHRLRRLNSVGARAARLGTRLQAVLLARYLPNPQTNEPRVTVAAKRYEWNELKTEAFWRAYLENRADLKVAYQPNYSFEVIPFPKVKELMGEQLSLESWDEDDRDDLREEIAQAADHQRWVQHASMTDAFGHPDKSVAYGEVDRTIEQIAQVLFMGGSLVLELLRAGLIDENFALYVSKLHGQAISASAMNFILKAVQPDLMDIEYHFGNSDAVDPAAIKSVLAAESARLFNGQSIYNIELFDHLLVEDSPLLDGPIRRLAATAANDRTFLDAYAVSGKAVDVLVRRLAAIWPEIFNYLLGNEAEPRDLSLLNAAFDGVQPRISYALTTDQRRSIAATLPRLKAIAEGQTADRATNIAKVMEQMHLGVDDLTAVHEQLRSELVARSLYLVSLTNLRAVLGADDQLPLDRIKRARIADVYPHVLTHLPAYLASLEEGTGIPTVTSTDMYASILDDVARSASDELLDVARRADPSCVLVDLTTIDASLWPRVVSAHRLAPTAQNVRGYIAEHGVDEPLSDWLSATDAIQVTNEEQPLRHSLALHLIGSNKLDEATKVRLTGSLDLSPGAILAASLDDSSRSLVPALVTMGLIEDGPDAYLALGSDNRPVKENLISVSKAFPIYMTDLDLSRNDLLMIASRPVPEAAKLVLLSNLDAFPELGPHGAKALAQWAADSGQTPSAEAIEKLAAKGREAAASSIVRLLAPQAATMDLELLKRALNSVGQPYSQLTSPGWDRPKIKITDEIKPILDRLRLADVVSKVVEKHEKGVFEISKRHH